MKKISFPALLLVVFLAAPLRGAQGKYYPLQLGEKDQEILDVVGGMDKVFERRGYVEHDPVASAIVQRVCSSVAPKEPPEPYMDFEYRILRDPSPNAFALPNGSVYITTSLLARLEDEAQLAAVCAHETNHVLGHHTFISMHSGRKKAAGAIAGSMVLGAATAQVGGVGGALLQEATGIGLQVLYVASVLGYSRDLEEEADRRAVERVVDAGYDPSAMLEVFDILGEDYEGLSTEPKTFWSDHPRLEDRTRYTKEILDNDYPDLAGRKDLRRGRESWLAGMEGVVREDVQLQIHSGFPRSAVQVARDLVDDFGRDPENLTLLGDAWVALGPRTLEPPETDTTKKAKKARRKDRYRKTREEREEERFETQRGRTAWEANRGDAEKAYDAALEADPGFAEAHRGRGYLFEKDGRFAEAAGEFEAYLAAAPDAMDRFVIQRHLAEARARVPAAKEDEGEPPTGGSG